MADIKVPELGESIVEATILSWRKNEGDPVAKGETVAELETDKVNVEVASEEDGVLEAILKPAGETVAVGETIARIQAGTPGEPAPGPIRPPAQGPESLPAQAEPSPAPAQGPTPPQPVQTPASAGAAQEPAPSGIPAPGPRTPSQRRRAHQASEPQVTPPTPGAPALAGREAEGPSPSSPPKAAAPATRAGIVPAPSRAANTPEPARTANAPEPARTANAPEPSRADEERVPMTRRRLTIARRLLEAKQSTAMLTTFNEVDMSAILDLRRRRKERFKEEHGVGLGFMSFFTKAAVGALKAFPMLNAEIRGNDIVLKHHYDIGIAVATPAGLVVPVIRDADRLRFAEIEARVADLAKRAREGALHPQELQGGTFTITNGGVFGSLFSTPILNPPQVGILGMHAIKERPVGVEGQLVLRPMMYLALSYDHRIVDGAEAVQFLVKIKEMVEDPETLLLEG